MPSQSLPKQQGDDGFSTTASDENEGRDGLARFFSSLQHLSRGSGSASGSWGGGWGSSSSAGGGGGGRSSHSLPWQEHQRAIIQSLRQGGASLSSFLGFSGSVSGSDLAGNGGGADADRPGSCACKRSSSRAATDGLPAEQKVSDKSYSTDSFEGGVAEQGGGENESGKSMGGHTAEKSGSRSCGEQDGYDGTVASAVAGALAVLSLGEISFEVRR